MIRYFFIGLIFLFNLSCKSDKNSSANKKDGLSELNVKDDEANAFEKTLIDYRDIDEQFLESFKVEGFGIQKKPNNKIGFVFKLHPETLESTIIKYSLGIRIFDQTIIKPRTMSFNPELTKKGDSKYIIVERVIDDMSYFDSIIPYIYKRKDWKGSGELGRFIVRDILFEEKNK